MANETLANGVVDAGRDAGDAVITLATGKINDGAGSITVPPISIKITGTVNVRKLLSSTGN